MYRKVLSSLFSDKLVQALGTPHGGYGAELGILLPFLHGTEAVRGKGRSRQIPPTGNVVWTKAQTQNRKKTKRRATCYGSSRVNRGFRDNRDSDKNIRTQF
ncbi:hypothetical protein EYZ11_009750 [Aspergillus tanneri]|uniref:Uncharacterized protein n=1 Tax=Aspergillus tanneri TaxID=1220188 RepID=A0A4S3J742_9EURO|nr:hypothetical protein EYZ11_009750 [Aspergillus tanneri]